MQYDDGYSVVWRSEEVVQVNVFFLLHTFTFIQDKLFFSHVS